MIKIQVIGTANSGKTVISNLISELLKDHGFNVTLKDYDSIQLCDIPLKIQALKDKGIVIEIETVQAKRSVDQ